MFANNSAEIASALGFVERFKREHGRPPRILHLGNLGNYAYINAKLQRTYGAEADCADPDFYHIMAAPEWLEADLSGDYVDEYRPKWSRMNKRGYRRPPWFIQGQERLVFAYLAARQAGEDGKARRLRREIELHRRIYTADVSFGEGLVQKLLSSPRFGLPYVRRAAKKALQWTTDIQTEAPPPTSTQVLPFEPIPKPEEFPVEPPLEMLSYIGRAPSFRAVLASYDIVQGYTIQALYPAAANLSNFASYELGTIRGLPFEDSPLGRVAKWVYQVSPEIFVTNIDCLEPAERLGIPRTRINKALHALDVDDAIQFGHGWSEASADSEVPLFFSPARQHWKEGNTSILKGNDVAIRGAAILKARGYRFKLVLAEWGSELELSKELIEELGISDCIEWCRPLPRRQLWSAYMRASAVIDQFRSPAFGGAALEVMALGRRLITAYDHDFGQEFFSDEPPIINCRTDRDVADAMERCIRDPEDSDQFGRRAQQWMLREHSVERQLAIQFRAYERILSSRARRESSEPMRNSA